MKERLLVSLIAGLGAFGTLAAQGGAGSIDPQCGTGSPVALASQDACQKALDLFAFLAPQLSGAVAGGNAVLGTHSSLRGPGHVSLGIRTNVVRARIPEITQHEPVITGAQASDYNVTDRAFPIPVIDAAIGVFRGIPVGATNTMGFDVIVNLSWLPSVSGDEVELAINGSSVKVGLGGRLTIMEETFMTPGIAVSYLRRDLPVLDISATPGNDELHLDDFQIKTSSWRAVIGKNFSMFGVTVGGGQDEYETSGLASVTVNNGALSFSAGPLAAIQVLKRDNVFASVAVNLPIVSVVLEGGRVSNGRVDTFNTFDSARADDALTYGSLGLRFTW